MAPLTTASLDDYYDLTAEDEAALLLQIDAQVSAPPQILTPPATKPVYTRAPVLGSRLGTGAGCPVRNTQSHAASTAPPRRDASGRGASPRQHLDTVRPAAAAASASVACDGALYPNLTGALKSPPADPQPADGHPAENTATFADPPGDNWPSPLERYRTPPRKPFSVTDFTSGGAWCELQYYYTLTRLPGGRKTRTAAMRIGSRVHKKLEEEVHTTVRVQVDTKEDVFGLRLWNVVQGLRTLRDTGLTREMEVWGAVDGHVVTGVIDSLSHSCPNEEFEDEVLSSQGSEEDHRGGGSPRKPRTVYLSDVKTRGKPSLPTGAALLRPAKIQLFLYHRLLSDMIAGRLDFSRVFRRLGVDPDEPFSDRFVAQMAGLHDEVFYDADPTPSQESGADPDPDADLNYRSCRELLALLDAELGLAFPEGAASLGQLVSVDYRFRGDGSVIGRNTFPVNDEALRLHLASDMQWWRGERAPRGVDIEDSFKCQFCEFAMDCEWRKGLEGERLRRAREKVEAGGGYF